MSSQSSNFQDQIAPSFHGRKVWMSGHTGFKGSWLCMWLLEMGAKVHGFALPPEREQSLFVQCELKKVMHHETGDLRDAIAVRKSVKNAQPDFVFHLAAQPLVRLSYREPLDTWQSNVLGTIHVLEALRSLHKPVSAVCVTTDKVYENRERDFAYREDDPLGGYDPYSSSKAAAEIAIASWRRSFFHSHPVRIASARAGNVIGGGDWAEDRIVPDAVRALAGGNPVSVRNPRSTRPWQHVLEPLSGYLLLASRLAENSALASSFNFGPDLTSNRPVSDLVDEILLHWPGQWADHSEPNPLHEAGKLNLATDRALHLLGWRPRWDFETTIARTVQWYRAEHGGADAAALTRQQIVEYCGS